MNYRDLHQGIITSALAAALLTVANISPVTASQEATGIMPPPSSRQRENYTKNITQQLTKLITLFSSKELIRLHISNDRSARGVPLNSLDDNIGMALNTLNDEQRVSIHHLIATVLSSGGYQHLTTIMNQKFLRQQMVDWDQSLLNDLYLPNARLLLTGNLESGNWGIRIGSPWFNVDIFFDRIDEQSRMTTGPLFFASYPTLTPAAPKIDDISQRSTYPYRYWHEQSGQSVLWKTGDFARTAIKQLRSIVRRKTCMQRDPESGKCSMLSKLPDTTQFMTTAFPTVRFDQLTAEERYYFTQLVSTFLDNRQAETQNRSDIMKKLDITRLAWAGDPEDTDAGFYLRLQSKSLLMELLQTPRYFDSDTLSLPNNATFMTFRDLNSPHDFDPISYAMQLFEQAKKLASSKISGNKNAAISINQSMSSEAITWLKEPSYLEGIEIKVGYKGKATATGTPFYPVVHAYLNGQPHKNIQVKITLQDQHGKAWIADLPLRYNGKMALYTSALTLPITMQGTSISITYTVRQPGSHYEGIYDATLPIMEAVPASNNECM